MDCKKWCKNLGWKEILKVSLIVGITSPFLTFTLGYYGTSDTLIFNLALGVIAAGLMLHKKLKSSWAIYIGMILTGFIATVVDYLISGQFL